MKRDRRTTECEEGLFQRWWHRCSNLQGSLRWGNRIMINRNEDSLRAELGIHISLYLSEEESGRWYSKDWSLVRGTASHLIQQHAMKPTLSSEELIVHMMSTYPTQTRAKFILQNLRVLWEFLRNTCKRTWIKVVLLCVPCLLSLQWDLAKKKKCTINILRSNTKFPNCD